jgi:hypothetical protein
VVTESQALAEDIAANQDTAAQLAKCPMVDRDTGACSLVDNTLPLHRLVEWVEHEDSPMEEQTANGKWRALAPNMHAAKAYAHSKLGGWTFHSHPAGNHRATCDARTIALN